MTQIPSASDHQMGVSGELARTPILHFEPFSLIVSHDLQSSS